MSVSNFWGEQFNKLQNLIKSVLLQILKKKMFKVIINKTNIYCYDSPMSTLLDY